MKPFEVRIAGRFQRAVRIDTDLGDPLALEGFVCPESSADALTVMFRHISSTGQSAFTWTGPFGSGKSSLVVVLSGLLSDEAKVRESAAKTLGSDLSMQIADTLATGHTTWSVLPVVGSRIDPVKEIGEAMRQSGLISRRQAGGWTEDYVIEKLRRCTTDNSGRGILLIIDEMGKFLESAAQNNLDIYVFQQIAELASRSQGRLVFVGVLHQAFVEYAHNLTSEHRDEWAKIQGRFIDLAVNATGDEQVDLIARAIQSDRLLPPRPGKLCRSIAELYQRDLPRKADRFANTLERCWPLHPVVALLLGPISRRRFGQNQRSIFGFLNSAEMHGFQHFANQHCQNEAYYEPSRLWDYLRINLEPSILASPDGHRWATASEALERCEFLGGEDLHIRLLKTIAIIDLFKERLRLVPSVELLRLCISNVSKTEFENALQHLVDRSLIIFKRHVDAYAIYAGSDFDIDEAVRDRLEEINSIDFKSLTNLAGLKPILAKRHYHETGTLRWFELALAPLHDIVERATNYKPADGIVGRFTLTIATKGESEEIAQNLCREAVKKGGERSIAIAFAKRSNVILLLAKELLALDAIRSYQPELSGDSVARKEIEARVSDLQGKLESELRESFNHATWHRKYYSEKQYAQYELNKLASDLADARFSDCPKIHSELLNRHKPSSSAAAARNSLLRHMLLNEGEERLGIHGYPPEAGLFKTLIEGANLYVKTDEGWRFVAPSSGKNPCRLFPIWEKAESHVKKNSDRRVAVSEIYELWRGGKYGVKEGLMAVFAMAFILSQRNTVAVYREGVFRTEFNDVDIDYLVRNAATIQLRWVNLSALSQRLLSEMAGIVRSLDGETTLTNLMPIDVARGLVRIFERLPPWTKRTRHLSKNAFRVRDLFKRASDPNQFLFYDIPAVVSEKRNVDIVSKEDLKNVSQQLRSGLEELVGAYGKMLLSLKTILLSELQLPDDSDSSLSMLRDRAENIREVAGDFRIEAFVGRLSSFDGTDEAFEGIVSLAINKPNVSWVDLDIDHAMVELADMAQHFLRIETFARVKGRLDRRHALAVILGRKGQPEPIMSDFQVGDADQENIEALAKKISSVLKKEQNGSNHIVLAALAEVCAACIIDQRIPQPAKQKKVAIR